MMKSLIASGRKETRRKAPAADAAFREARKSSTVPVFIDAVLAMICELVNMSFYCILRESKGLT